MTLIISNIILDQKYLVVVTNHCFKPWTTNAKEFTIIVVYMLFIYTYYISDDAGNLKMSQFWF